MDRQAAALKCKLTLSKVLWTRRDAMGITDVRAAAWLRLAGLCRLLRVYQAAMCS